MIPYTEEMHRIAREIEPWFDEKTGAPRDDTPEELKQRWLKAREEIRLYHLETGFI